MRTRMAAPVASLLPTVALAAVAVIWGITFTVVDSSADALPPPDLVAWRFGLGTLVLTLFRRSGPPMPRRLRRRGRALGGLLGAGFLLQTWALTYTDALMSGFLTSVLVVVAPVAGWLLFRDRLSRGTLLGVTLATIGLVLLSLHRAGFGPGEMITLAAAVAWGIHMVLLSRWSEPQFALQLARIQTGVVTAMALTLVAFTAALTGSVPLPHIPADGGTWVSVLFLAVFASAAAMVLLSWSQSRLSATRAAIILTLEPAVAALTAVVLGAELTVRIVVGGAFLLVAMFTVEVGSASTPVSAHRSP